MASPVRELQKAIMARLKADAAVTAIVSSRVYDNPPKDRAFPNITMGVTDETSDDVDCVNGYEIAFQVDAWSRLPDADEIQVLSDAIRRALRADLTVENNAVVYFNHRQTRTFQDPDGITQHAALTYEALLEER